MSLPELLPDAQHMAERVEETLFLLKDLEEENIGDWLCVLVLFRFMDQEVQTSFFVPLGSSPDVLMPDRNKTEFHI